MKKNSVVINEYAFKYPVCKFSNISRQGFKKDHQKIHHQIHETPD